LGEFKSAAVFVALLVIKISNPSVYQALRVICELCDAFCLKRLAIPISAL
jgi:hypothetical protein